MKGAIEVGPYSPPPCIIVPVYNAPEETEACLRSIVRETYLPYRVLVLDDASSDPLVSPMLRDLAEEFPILETHRHDDNLGFAANVNFGMRLAEGDVVLLNSDTVVSTGWLDRMVACAYSRTDVATVTAVSNAAGAFSAPENNRVNRLPDGMSVNAMAEEAARVAAPLPVVAPTGNGFCLYVRRDALVRLGLFDADAFPHVAEENDFGQRAILAGMVNLVDSSCYIYHARSASFGSDEAKSRKLVGARARIDRRYPDYKRQVAVFLRTPELGAFRSRLRSALNRRSSPRVHERPRILSVVHNGGGGMVHTNKDLMKALLASFDTYELRCGLNDWQLARMDDDRTIAEWQFGTSWSSVGAPDVPRRMALRSVVKVLEFDLVHVRTLIATGPEILTNLARTGVPVVVSFHDFATVCPTIQLVDENLRFCGGHCTPSRGECRVALNWFSDVRNLKHQGVYRWRERMAANLPLADAFVTSSDNTREVLIEHFPVLGKRRFDVIEHGRDRADHKDAAVPPGSPLKVVAFGALSIPKGIRLMEAMFEAAARSKRDLEFHLLGELPGYHKVDFPCVLYHGPYERGALPRHLQEISPSYALICPIWPETYCHTLTEAWLSGLPVLASDIGVVAERVKRHGGGRLVEPHRPELWLEALDELRCKKTWHSLHDQVSAIGIRGVSDMAREYEELYRSMLYRD